MNVKCVFFCFMLLASTASRTQDESSAKGELRDKIEDIHDRTQPRFYCRNYLLRRSSFADSDVRIDIKIDTEARALGKASLVLSYYEEEGTEIIHYTYLYEVQLETVADTASHPEGNRVDDLYFPSSRPPQSKTVFRSKESGIVRTYSVLGKRGMSIGESLSDHDDRPVDGHLSIEIFDRPLLFLDRQRHPLSYERGEVYLAYMMMSFHSEFDGAYYCETHGNRRMNLLRTNPSYFGRGATIKRLLFLFLLLAISAEVHAQEDAPSYQKFEYKTSEDGWGDLMHAAAEGDEFLVRSLIDNGDDVNARSADGETALMVAAKEGEVKVVEMLLDAGASFNAVSYTGFPVLMYATLGGDTDVVRFLLAYGADPNSSFDGPDDLGITPLMHAAQLGGRTGMMNLLIAYGANIEAYDNRVTNALEHAIFRGDVAAMGILIDAGASVDTESYWRTPLMLAARLEDEAAMGALINAGADMEAWPPYAEETLLREVVSTGNEVALGVLIDSRIDLEDDRHHTRVRALALAVSEGQETILRMLIDAGADIEARNGMGGGTALMVSTSANITQALIDAGADIEAQGGQGERALMLAPFVDIARALIDAGADANATDQYGRTSLVFAASKGRVAVMEALIEAGADPEISLERMLIAAIDGGLATVKVLIDAGVDVVDAPEEWGRTALMFAAQRSDDPRVVRELLYVGARVNDSDAFGFAPLMLAASSGNVDIVKMLLDAGASVDATNRWGQTAWDRAKNGEIRDLLQP